MNHRLIPLLLLEASRRFSLPFPLGRKDNGKWKAKGHDKHPQGDDDVPGRAYEKYGLHEQDCEIVTTYNPKHGFGPAARPGPSATAICPPACVKKLQP